MAPSSSVVKNKRQRWQHEENKELITCWLLSNSSQRGFRKRLHSLWTERNPGRPTSEQLIAGQVRAVLQRREFSDLEIEELRRDLGLLNDDPSDNLEEPRLEAIDTATGDPSAGEADSGSVSSSETDHQISQEARPLYDKLKLYTMQQQDSVPNGLCLPSLKSIKKNSLMKVVNTVNELCEHFSTTTLQETVDLIFAAARVVVEQFEMSCQPKSCSNHVSYSDSQPPWKKRLNNKIQYLRKDLSRLVAMQQGQLQNQQTVSHLQTKYLNGSVSQLPSVIETIKQKILAYSNKLRRYTARGQSFYQSSFKITNESSMRV